MYFNKDEGKQKSKKTIGQTMTIFVLLSIVISLIFVYIAKKNANVNVIPKLNKYEVLKSMSYEQAKEDEKNIEATSNVKFDAFFLRDLDNNGYAEKLRGTCRKIGEEDVLYMEINVLTSGYLKDGKITINGKNFYLNTTLPKDNELMENYIGTNIKEIKLNQLNNGTQKTLTGIVRSGNYSSSYKKSAISSTTINDYSRNDNEVTLTGIYVDNGVETPITKKVKLTVDWYGTTRAYIGVTSRTYTDLDSRIDEQNGKIKLEAYISSQEGNKELNLSKNYVEGTIPEFNGYVPSSVTCSNTNIEFTYDETTRVFTITKLAKVDETGKISPTLSESNYYTVKISYPLEAYTKLGGDAVTIKIPVKTYYEGFNNPNDEFTNPYKSNIAEAVIVQTFRNPTGTVANIDITVGEYLTTPFYRYSISKRKPLKIYNGVSKTEKDDTYNVRWYVTTGINGKDVKFTLKETKDEEAQVSDQFIKTNSTQESMENLTSNIGIYFSNVTSMLGDNGILKIYDDETNKLLATFKKEDWIKYTSSNPYKYDSPVKHIRIETSEALASKYMYIYNIKELDDKYITENYTKEEFDTFAYIKSTLTAYIDDQYLARDTHQAKYEQEYSIANISISKETISTQTTEKNEKLYIEVNKDENSNVAGWMNGNFLIKLPKEILELEINDVTINNNKVKIINYEIIEQDGFKFIKVNTLNVNDNEQTYTITIDADITPDPRSVTAYKIIELYANNEVPSTYYSSSNDIYDVNLNLNTTEKINKTTTSLNLISPNSLITNKIATNFDDKGTVIVSPQVANVNAKQEEGISKATIGVQFKNNYTNSVSEVAILGKIPFIGNTYVINKGDLGSEFTTTMANTGIKIPDTLAGKVTTYYSEKEDPDKDLSKSANGWIKAENVADWKKIKTYLLDFENTVIEKLSEYIFYYDVIVPEEEDLNKIAYAHHAIYFSFDTEQGKYITKTEPNKIGVRIAETFNINLTKYQKGFDNVVYGAKYSITEINSDGTKGTSKTALTNINGKLSFKNIFVGKTYEIKEEVTADGYELNKDIIRITANFDENRKLKINKTINNSSEETEIEKDTNKEYNYTLNVEDAAEINLEIIKIEKGTNNTIQGVEYKLTGENISSSGRRLKTDANGKITLTDLNEGQVYTLEETKAENYYLAEPIKFKVSNTNGIYSIDVLKRTS